MAEDTKIQWATHTFNPWRGCTKIASGCANCYADAQSKRNPATLGIWGPNGTRVVASEAMWRDPMKWDRAARQAREDWSEDRAERESLAFPGKPERPRVFCASLADVFEDWRGQVVNSRGDRLEKWLGEGRARTPMTLDDVRARLFRTIDQTPNLDWLLLTKRPENVRRMIPWLSNGEGESSPSFHAWQRRKNVWLGTSIACQEDADRNIPELLKCSDLCAKTFLSIEPLIGPVDITPWIGGRLYRCKCGYHRTEEELAFSGGDRYLCVTCGERCAIEKSVDWVIVGGESGRNARPCDIAWIRSIVRQCRDAGVPCFVKQIGAFPIGYDGETSLIGAKQLPFGNGAWKRVFDPKGGDPDEWPNDVRVREVPTA